jgi:hypothetical protein
MKWKKLGLVFEVNNANSYLVSHASNPLAIHLENDEFRVFFSGRDEENKSSVGYVDIDIDNLSAINSEKKPLLIYGEADSFYSHGISIGNLYTGLNNKNYILFMGWQIPDNNHWRGDIGRIELVDKHKMQLVSEEAFLGTDKEDPISLSYPYVIFHEGIYKMWYGSTIDWTSENGEMIHVIKYATSKDGEDWEKHGIAIPYEIGVAQAFSRPSVIIDEKGYHMWYSYRDGSGKKYRIGYSHSLDGVNWENKLDSVGINTSEQGWDSEMICYPFVFDHKGKRYMLYNGNSYGKFGFGLAILDE